MLYICVVTKITFQLRYFIELAYKGTNYHGWQVQPNAITVQELVNKTCTTILRTPVEAVGAGRTDAGVHATQLFAHIDIEKEFDITKTLYKINALLPNDIVMHNIYKVNTEAHARFNAVSRSYEYHIFLGRNPFLNETTWQLVAKKLDVNAMNKATQSLLKYSNFKCFSRSNSDVHTYNCKISHAKWVQEGGKLTFYITANRFLRNMVRAIVGTLIDVGLQKTSQEAFLKIIESKDRRKAGTSVPPQGLFLTKVKYPKTIFIDG